MVISLLRTLTVLLLSTVVVYAQPQQKPSSLDQALAARIQQEMNNNIQCLVQSLDMKKELETAQARVKELEDKYEKKIGSK